MNTQEIIVVRIQKSSRSSSWYRDDIGMTYEVVDYSADHYLVVASLTTPIKLLVEKQDVEVVK